jgi:hypothetical protein
MTNMPNRGIELMPSVARPIIEELFERQEQWRRDDLVSEVKRVHAERRGVAGNQNPSSVVSKALGYLQEDGKVLKLAYGVWKRASTDGTDTGSDIAETTGSMPTPEEDAPVAEKVIGVGGESVYLYFNPNDRELASHQGRTVWECKIGLSTGKSGVLARILGQGTKTALSHPPVVALEMRTHDCAALERALHLSLRLIDASVPDSPGTEWFMTSPQRVEKWFTAYQDALSHLKCEEPA